MRFRCWATSPRAGACGTRKAAPTPCTKPCSGAGRTRPSSARRLVAARAWWRCSPSSESPQLCSPPPGTHNAPCLINAVFCTPHGGNSFSEGAVVSVVRNPVRVHRHLEARLLVQALPEHVVPAHVPSARSPRAPRAGRRRASTLALRSHTFFEPRSSRVLKSTSTVGTWRSGSPIILV